MKTKLALLALTFFFLFSTAISAQDVIVLKNNKKIEVKILEINDYEIKYNDYRDIGGIVFTVDRATVKEIKYEFGRKDKEENPEDNEIYFAEDKFNNIKLNFTSLGGASAILGFERAITHRSSFEVMIEIHGLGFNNYDDKSGIGIDGLYKFKLGSMYKKRDSYRPKHLLEGWFLSPTMGISFVSQDIGEYEKYAYLHAGLNISRQWVIQNALTIELFYGFHYFGGNFEERYDNEFNDRYNDGNFTDGNLIGTGNVAQAFGINVGFLIGRGYEGGPATKKKKR